jgi:hypothetical protein
LQLVGAQSEPSSGQAIGFIDERGSDGAQVIGDLVTRSQPVDLRTEVRGRRTRERPLGLAGLQQVMQLVESFRGVGRGGTATLGQRTVQHAVQVGIEPAALLGRAIQ